MYQAASTKNDPEEPEFKGGDYLIQGRSLDVLLAKEPVTSRKKGGSRKEKNVDDYFLKGPVPIGWLTKAAQFKGKVLVVGNALWFLYGLNKGKPFKMERWVREGFKVSRQTYSRTLKLLQGEGLISVVNIRGSSSVVTMCWPPGEVYNGKYISGETSV